MKNKKQWWVLALLLLATGLFIGGCSHFSASNKTQETETTLSPTPEINMAQLKAKLSNEITGADDTPSIVSMLAYDSKRVFGLYAVKDSQTVKNVIFRAEYTDNGSIEKAEFITTDEDYQEFVPEISAFLDKNLIDLVADNTSILENESP